MRELLVAAGAVALALGLIGAAVFGAGDGSLFVPPPEAAAEDFVRALSTARYDIARNQMADAARQRERASQLGARFEPVRQHLGKINDVDANASFTNESTAHATATVEGERGTATLLLQLVREQGVWKVDWWELGSVTE